MTLFSSCSQFASSQAGFSSSVWFGFEWYSCSACWRTGDYSSTCSSPNRSRYCPLANGGACNYCFDSYFCATFELGKLAGWQMIFWPCGLNRLNFLIGASRASCDFFTSLELQKSPVHLLDSSIKWGEREYCDDVAVFTWWNQGRYFEEFDANFGSVMKALQQDWNHGQIRQNYLSLWPAYFMNETFHAGSLRRPGETMIAKVVVYSKQVLSSEGFLSKIIALSFCSRRSSDPRCPHSRSPGSSFACRSAQHDYDNLSFQGSLASSFSSAA